ncbi:hypothetical protein KDI_35170 [Dictyobacter arantiisoli]|uniref:Uncharacterized protein n=1 Tax=Dictyobacter arantiisoli TaxID=2014874 RepID=A0A5A5TFX0_9CHLR|nr:hypothetical protein KDI_35170 [Dictyobacter arantiisoli]
MINTYFTFSVEDLNDRIYRILDAQANSVSRFWQLLSQYVPDLRIYQVAPGARLAPGKTFFEELIRHILTYRNPLTPFLYNPFELLPG